MSEYDMRGGVRGKYYQRYINGTLRVEDPLGVIQPITSANTLTEQPMLSRWQQIIEYLRVLYR